MKLLPVLLPLLATPPRARSAALALPELAPPPVDARDPSEPDWRQAYLRLREQQPHEAEPALPMPALSPAPREPAPEAAAVGPVPATPTMQRLEAARQLAEPVPTAAPLARSWQVELPAGGGTAWRLQVEQAQPLAPLNLELRVPPVAQTQARQQLGDLDKRLREAGHDVLRSRLRDATWTDRWQRPVDGVEP